jgi:hypothetical protein
MSNEKHRHQPWLAPTPEPDSLDETVELLRRTSQQIQQADGMLAALEEQQKELIGHLHQLLDLVGKLEVERNTWKFRAEEMEVERNIWHSKAEDALSELRSARRRNVELGILTGEARCPQCGANQLVLLHGNFPTGVTAPDGVSERWYECALECQECGHREEV